MVVAEDESLIRLDIVEILRDNGFEVVGEAGDGETAVALATELAPTSSSWTSRCPARRHLRGGAALEGPHRPGRAPHGVQPEGALERAAKPRPGLRREAVHAQRPLPAIEIALARYAQIIALEAEVGDLVERFETRKLVDRAKGLLNEKMGLSEPEAFRWIQKASMDRRLTMKDVSQAIIEQLAAKK